MHRALFICTQNRLRSPTAEHVFSIWPEVETDSAGLGADADVPLSLTTTNTCSRSWSGCWRRK